MKLRAIVILLLLTNIGAALFAQDESTPVKYPLLAFESKTDTARLVADIFIIGTKGGGRTNLTNHPADDICPSWSPDGQTIAFSTNRDGNYEIYTMAFDGTDLINLTNHPANDYCAAWSPDGTRIAFSSDRNSADWDLYMMNVDGTQATLIASNEGNDVAPTWSPDSQSIIFSSQQTGDFELYHLDLETGKTLLLTDASDNYQAYSPDWSPVNNSIVYWASSKDPRGGYKYPIIDPQGHLIRDDPDESLALLRARWSADGQQLIYTSAFGSGFIIFNADGTRIHRNYVSFVVPNTWPEDEFPVWQPQPENP